MSAQTFIQESTGGLTKSGNGEYEIKLIGADVLGSSGYYPRSVVESDGPKAFPKLTKIYADHPSRVEMEERPVRSVRGIAGKLTSEPYMKEDGLYARVKFGRDYQNLVEDFHDVIGMSIFAAGKLSESEDESGNIVVEAILPSLTNSVDLVTVPGAEGKIVGQVAESLRRIETDKDTERKVPVDEKDIKAIAEALKPYFDALVESVDALVPEAPSEEVTEPDMAAVTESALEAGLPKAARARVIEAVRTGADEKEAIEAEKGYIEQVLAESKTEDKEDGDVGAPGHLHESGQGAKLSAAEKFDALWSGK